MAKNISYKEENRRKLNTDFDDKPSVHHLYNYKIAKTHIKRKKLLDIGCWTGQFIQLALNDAKITYGIDPGKKAINFAQKKYPQAHLEVATAQKLPFRNNTFDVITFLEVIEHLPKEDETGALNEIYRVLKKNGTLVLSTPSSHPTPILLDPAYFLIGHRHYSEKQLKNLLSKSGFEIIKIYKTGGIFRLTSLIFDSIVKHLLKTKFAHPQWLQEQINKEYKNNGFAQLHVIAKKCSKKLF